MKSGRLDESIAFCGLVYGICDHNPDCTWCRSPLDSRDKCAKDGCYHGSCCIKCGLDGCWQCESFPCSNGRFLDADKGQMLGFLRYIRKYGKEEFVSRLVLNQRRGIMYGMKGAYRHRSVEEIEKLLNDEEELDIM